MADQGVAPKRLQARMGHASLKITMDLYGHLFPMSKDDVAQINESTLRRHRSGLPSSWWQKPAK